MTPAPTFWTVARRPRWIALLVLALLVAAAFAALGQWQLDRSVSGGQPVPSEESVAPLATLDTPQQEPEATAFGRLASVEGSFVPGDGVVLHERLHHGVEGYWAVGHLRAALPDGGEADLAVALGWSADLAGAERALAAVGGDPVALTGRYTPAEGVSQSDPESGELRALVPGQLLNLWANTSDGGAYGGYLIALDSPQGTGLEAIHTPPPSNEVSINWLNIFYAIEWAVFAVFAVFLWQRLVRDARDREIEEAEEEQQEGVLEP